MLTHFKRFFSIFLLRPFQLASPLIFCLSLLGVFHAWSGTGWMNCKALRLEGGGAEAEAEAEAGAAGKEDEAAALPRPPQQPPPDHFVSLRVPSDVAALFFDAAHAALRGYAGGVLEPYLVGRETAHVTLAVVRLNESIKESGAGEGAGEEEGEGARGRGGGAGGGEPTRRLLGDAAARPSSRSRRLPGPSR